MIAQQTLMAKYAFVAKCGGDVGGGSDSFDGLRGSISSPLSLISSFILLHNSNALFTSPLSTNMYSSSCNWYQ